MRSDCVRCCTRLLPSLHRFQRDSVGSFATCKRDDAREVRRRGLTDNIKLSTGRSREIELCSGVPAHSRRTRTVAAIALFPANAQRHCRAASVENDAEQLRVAYLVLRRLENLLQSINDEQTPDASF
ncbi:hypothetical protein ACNKHR_17400 [Shigella flexneri]